MEGNPHHPHDDDDDQIPQGVKDLSDLIPQIEEEMQSLGLHTQGAWVIPNSQLHQERMHEARILGQPEESVDMPVMLALQFTTSKLAWTDRVLYPEKVEQDKMMKDMGLTLSPREMIEQDLQAQRDAGVENPRPSKETMDAIRFLTGEKDNDNE